MGGDDSAADGETRSAEREARPAAVTFVTTEHFVLQSARTATTSESTSRATIFIGSVSAGLVALGFFVSAVHVGTAFYVFGLILLATLALMGFVTFDRVLQSGIEDFEYSERIARLRAYYFDHAPELTQYLASVPPDQRLAILGLHHLRGQNFRTVAAMIGVVTAVLTGSAAGLLAVITSGHSAVVGFVTGAVTSAVVFAVLIWHQRAAWQRAERQRLFDDGGEASVEA